MKSTILPLLLSTLMGFAAPAAATGLATCDSGAQSGWKSQDDLKAQLAAKGWKIRRIKIDGGCYEVYAINEKGERVESYFHPVTFDHVLTSKR
jgi:hypothetical protein